MPAHVSNHSFQTTSPCLKSPIKQMSMKADDNFNELQRYARLHVVFKTLEYLRRFNGYIYQKGGRICLFDRAQKSPKASGTSFVCVYEVGSAFKPMHKQIETAAGSGSGRETKIWVVTFASTSVYM